MLAKRVSFFGESVIRETTRLAARYNAINLAQGMPDFETPQELKDAARRAIQDGYNQYAITWGAPILRLAIAHKAKTFNHIANVDPDKHITVCCGATECMRAALLATINPGDEVVIFQPYYENYGPDGLLTGAKVVWVKLRVDDSNDADWQFDRDELARAFNDRTRAIIINTPGNPTGKIFAREELQFIADLCIQHDAPAITDEIYEHIIYSDAPHISIASLDGMADRTVTISGLSKTYSMTGWRLGYCIANEQITTAIRKVHDFLTVGAPHPLHVAGAAALALPESYYTKLREDYRKRRAVLLGYLREAGFLFTEPRGAYYVMTDVSPFIRPDENDTAFVHRMVETVGVAGVPGSSFYHPREDGFKKVRFMWAKKEETLHAAGQRLLKLREMIKRS